MATVMLKSKSEQVLPGTEFTRSLARFISSLQAEVIPVAVEDVLRKAIVDVVGCGLFGLTTEWGRMVQQFAAEQGGPTEASLWAKRSVGCGSSLEYQNRR